MSAGPASWSLDEVQYIRHGGSLGHSHQGPVHSHSIWGWEGGGYAWQQETRRKKGNFKKYNLILIYYKLPLEKGEKSKNSDVGGGCKLGSPAPGNASNPTSNPVHVTTSVNTVDFDSGVTEPVRASTPNGGNTLSNFEHMKTILNNSKFSSTGYWENLTQQIQ